MRTQSNGYRCAACMLAALLIWVGTAPADSPSELLPKMVTPKTAKAIDRGLRYLARTQRADGSWVNRGGYGSYPIVMTSLSGLALLANGSTPESGTYSREVAKALNYVLNIAEANIKEGDPKIMIAGGAGSTEGRSMYGHGFGMLFLAQCYGVEGDKTTKRAERILKVLNGGVALTAAAQSDLGEAQKHAGGWIYTPSGNGDEGSVTVTQLQALRACRNVGIKVPKETIDRTVEYLKYCQQADGGICYSARSRGASQPAISAAAVACFYAAGVYDEKTGGRGEEAKMVERLIEYCRRTVNVNQRSGHFFYTHFYMAQGWYMRGGKDWEAYYPQIRDYMLGQQMEDGNWNGDSVGPTYGTALATMILQLPYGYLPIFQR